MNKSVVACLFEMLLEPGFEFWIGRGFRHLWERFDELLFSAVEVFEFMMEEIVKGI